MSKENISLGLAVVAIVIAAIVGAVVAFSGPVQAPTPHFEETFGAAGPTSSTNGDWTVKGGTLIVNNLGNTAAPTATSSINAGCIQLNATSSATTNYLVLSPAGATSTFAGTAYWAYGTCPNL